MSDYEVGYGKPPKSGQFKKGQSGNPRGRPALEMSVRQEALSVLEVKVPVIHKGRQIAMPLDEASLRMWSAKAIQSKKPENGYPLSGQVSAPVKGRHQAPVDRSHGSHHSQELGQGEMGTAV